MRAQQELDKLLALRTRLVATILRPYKTALKGYETIYLLASGALILPYLHAYAYMLSSFVRPYRRNR